MAISIPPERLKSNAEDNFKNEFQKIKEYIKNPREIGLWKTTIALSKTTKNEESFQTFIQSFFKRNPYSSPYTILTLLEDINHIGNPPNNTQYNIKESYKKIIEKVIRMHYIDSENNILRINGRFLFIPADKNLTILSLSKEMTNDLENILRYTGYATIIKKEKIFSPKEVLFTPYYFYINIISDTLFSTSKEIEYINKALNFNSQHHQYEETIRMIGKAYESTLAHIYETLLRKDSSHLSSISNLLINIESEIQKILNDVNQGKKHTPKSISIKIYKACKDLEKRSEDKSQKIINHFKKIAEDIDNEEKSMKELMLFPSEIQKYLKDAKELRNQVSHHNTTINTQEDANSILFSYVQIYLWWQEVCQYIDNWDGTKKEVLQEFENLKIDSRILEFNNFLKQKYIPITPPRLYV